MYLVGEASNVQVRSVVATWNSGENNEHTPELTFQRLWGLCNVMSES